MFHSIVRTIRPVVILSASIIFSSAALSAQTAQSAVPSRIVSTIDESSRVSLRGYVSPLANAANDRGAAPDSMPLTRMHLVLKRSPAQENSLRQFISGAHTAGSANYHKWLTPDQFGQQFGPSDQDVATVESWLSSHGFEVSGVKPGKQVIEFSGNVAQLRSAFNAQIHKYEVKGNTHYATANEPDIPAALAPVVGGFASLNDFPPAKLMARVLGTASYDPKTDQATPNWTYGNSTGVNYVLAPGDFGVQYDLPNTTLNSTFTGTTLDGTGQTIAILDFANINIDLVNQFRSMFGLPANPPNVIIDGNDPGIDGINNPDGENGASIESYLDVEWAGAVAPKATIDLVVAADTALESGGILAAEHAVYGDIAPVISASIDVGGCEQEAGSINSFISGLWEEAAAQGQTVVVAAGDSGSAGCDNDNVEEYAINGLGVNSWASTPYNVAAGGTDFYYSDYASSSSLTTQLATYWNTTASQSPSVSIKSYIPEQPWNDSQFGLDALNYYSLTGGTSIAGGSGGASSSAVCSTSYSSTTGACTGTLSGYPKPAWQTGAGVPADKVRDMPDISLFAADGLNYSYYPICAQDGDCQTPSGSSLYQITGVGGTSAAAPAFAAIMALVNEKYGPQGQADYVLYALKTSVPTAFHDITNGTNSVPCSVNTIELGTIVAPVDCIAAKTPVTITDPNYGVSVVEGQVGTGTTPDYNAAAGYNLATGLGSVDASVLISNWTTAASLLKATTMTLAPSSTSFTHGTAISISGAVTGTTVPTGAVSLMTNSTEPLQQSQTIFPLTNGDFSNANVNYLPGGTYNIWGQYGGDGINGASSSTQVQITVTPEASTTVFDILNAGSSSNVISSGASVPYGSQLILAAQAYGTSYYNSCVTTASTSAACASYGIPTGTVTFSDNGTPINTAVINAEGDAEFNGAYAIGSHSVTASYSGDNSYSTSAGTAVSFTIAKNTPNLELGLTATTTQGDLPSGQASILSIIVENSANVNSSTGSTAAGYPYTVPAAAPTGSISITGITGVSTATLAAGVDPSNGEPAGIATVTIPASAATGNLSFSVSYPGDSNYSSASGSTSLPFANIGGTASSITASLSGSVSPTTTVTVTGTVTGSVGGAAPTGSVLILAAGNQLAEVSLVAPTTAKNTAPDNQLHRLDLLASGGGAFLACVLLLTVPARRRAWRNMLGLLLAACIVSFGIGCGGGGSGGSGGSGGGGSGGSGGGGGGSALSSSFSVSLNSALLLQGSNTITVEYVGNSTYAPSSYMISTAVNNPLSDFTLVAASANVAVQPGATTTTTVFASPANGFSGSVNLACSVVGSPTGVTCSLNQSSVSLNYALSATPTNLSMPVILTVTTTGSSTAANDQVIVTGTAGSQVHTVGVTAIVQ